MNSKITDTGIHYAVSFSNIQDAKKAFYEYCENDKIFTVSRYDYWDGDIVFNVKSINCVIRVVEDNEYGNKEQCKFGNIALMDCGMALLIIYDEIYLGNDGSGFDEKIESQYDLYARFSEACDPYWDSRCGVDGTEKDCDNAPFPYNLLIRKIGEIADNIEEHTNRVS